LLPVHQGKGSADGGSSENNRGHARSDRLMRYAKTELAGNRELMARKVIRLKKRRDKFKAAS